MRITESQLRRIIRQEILREQGGKTPQADTFIAAFDKWYDKNAKALGRGVDDAAELTKVIDHIKKKFEESGAKITPAEVAAASRAAIEIARG
jgi:hypothetical protein